MELKEGFFHLEPSQKKLITLATAQPLDFKIEQAIRLLQLHEGIAKSLSPDSYWLAYSGGKDSDTILELAKMAGIKYRPVYNVTTIDPPELVRYIKQEHPEVVFNRPGKALLTTLLDKSYGPPTRIARWCCEKYKESGGKGTARIIGVRAQESKNRAINWAQVKTDTKDKQGVYICPIIYWTTTDIWNFHRLRGIPHCSLYDEGFHRLGCIGCPLSGPSGQTKEFTRWPKYEQLWRRAFDRFWDKWHGVPRDTPLWVPLARLQPPNNEQIEYRTINGKKQRGYWTTTRWFEHFGSAERLWRWWRSGKGQGKSSTCSVGFFFT